MFIVSSVMKQSRQQSVVQKQASGMKGRGDEYVPLSHRRAPTGRRELAAEAAESGLEDNFETQIANKSMSLRPSSLLEPIAKWYLERVEVRCTTTSKRMK